MEEILNYLIPEKYSNFKCYDLLKEKLKSNLEFRYFISKGIEENKINGISTEIIENLFSLNAEFRGSKNYADYLKEGKNIGDCAGASKYFAFLLDDCELVIGYNEYLINTKNSSDGTHFWIDHNDIIYDTTFMLTIDSNYLKLLKYLETSRWNPRICDPIFCEREKRAKDKSLRGGKQCP